MAVALSTEEIQQIVDAAIASLCDDSWVLSCAALQQAAIAHCEAKLYDALVYHHPVCELTAHYHSVC